jgi:PBP1b-binding outer membrane lipoprotein LpoB
MKLYLSLPLLVSTFAVVLPACADHAVYRGSTTPGLDAPAMSTSLDKDDMERALTGLLNDMRGSPVMAKWQQDGGNDTVAILAFENDTSEHIDSQLAAMLNDTETWLARSSTVVVISHERQEQMIDQVQAQTRPVFNQQFVAQYGQQLGIKYFITGKVNSSDEMTTDARRVQYFLYMQVIEVATSAVRWEQKAAITKLET